MNSFKFFFCKVHHVNDLGSWLSFSSVRCVTTFRLYDVFVRMHMRVLCLWWIQLLNLRIKETTVFFHLHLQRSTSLNWINRVTNHREGKGNKRREITLLMMMRINYYWWLIDNHFCSREKGRRGKKRKGAREASCLILFSSFLQLFQ